MKENLLSLLGRRLLIFDGATGTVLQSMGLRPGEHSDAWNISRPDDIKALHREYLRAGADIIKSNTFVAARPGSPDADKIAVAGCRLAREAVDEAGHGFVALDLGPTGHLLHPLGDLNFEDAVALYKNVIRSGAPYCDCVLCETMTDIYEAKAAIIAAKESCDLPIFVSFTVDKNRRLLSGADITTFAAVAESLGVSAVGLNCGTGPEAMEQALPELLGATSLPVIVSPNAGLPTVDGERTYYNMRPAEYAEYNLRMAKMGAAAVGGCCGTTPDFIRETSALVAGMNVVQREVSLPTRAASGACTVTFGTSPIVIGERINPTGKPKLRDALKSGDMDKIVALARSQADAGADALDINCGVPGTDERETLLRAVREVQAAVRLPLVIDTSDINAMEAALRAANGKPIVNSVNGKREVMDDVFPLVKKYGGVLIGLTLDEGGIPPTADGRLEIARRIVNEAEKYGIPRRDILIDALTLTVAADKDAAKTTLDAVEKITRELSVGTVLGVSNVSFGLPDRDAVNAAFLTLALSRGLSAAILNPESEAMKGALSAYKALSGDFSDLNKANAEQSYTLAEAVLRGNKNDSVRLTSELLDSGVHALEIIDGHIIPGLSRLGEEYESGRSFLPQLIAGADAASASFEEIKKRMGGGCRDRGIVIMATVEGDVHDIGKNIVSALLSNYGYDVHDLGKDVPPEKIVAETLSTGARLVGLSALMTTTVPSMRKTIEALRAACDCKIAVGGAVLTHELARDLGADYYSSDAMQTVRIADEVYGTRRGD